MSLITSQSNKLVTISNSNFSSPFKSDIINVATASTNTSSTDTILNSALRPSSHIAEKDITATIFFHTGKEKSRFLTNRILAIQKPRTSSDLTFSFGTPISRHSAFPCYFFFSVIMGWKNYVDPTKETVTTVKVKIRFNGSLVGWGRRVTYRRDPTWDDVLAEYGLTNDLIRIIRSYERDLLWHEKYYKIGHRWQLASALQYIKKGRGQGFELNAIPFPYYNQRRDVFERFGPLIERSTSEVWEDRDNQVFPLRRSERLRRFSTYRNLRYQVIVRRIGLQAIRPIECRYT